MERDESEAGPVVPASAGFLGAARAVFWSFFGVRKRSDYERDVRQLNPVHVIIAGLIGALLFVVVLILVVKSVVR